MYWIKPLNNAQSPRVTFNEQFVGRVGEALGLPTCRVALIEISGVHAGYQVPNGPRLEEGVAHGSEAHSGAAEVRSLDHPTSDANARRYVGVFALYDLCWGGDYQWLELTDADLQVFSHDHGHYFPNGPNWTVDGLKHNVGAAHEAPWQTTGLAADEAERVAQRLRDLTAHDLGRIVEAIPSTWPVTDDEVAHAAWFVFSRRDAVAQRLLTKFGVT